MLLVAWLAATVCVFALVRWFPLVTTPWGSRAPYRRKQLMRSGSGTHLSIMYVATAIAATTAFKPRSSIAATTSPAGG